MSEYLFTTEVFLTTIIGVYGLFEFVLMAFRYKNGEETIIERDVEIHMFLLVYSLSISGAFGGLEIALVANVVDRIRVRSWEARC